MGHRDGTGRNPEKIVRKGGDILVRDPGSTQVGVDIARQDVFRLDLAQGLCVACEGGACPLGFGPLRADIAGEVNVCRFPLFGSQILENRKTSAI